MNIFQRYRRLSLWSKIGLWGSLASILGIALAIIPNIAGLTLLRQEITQRGTIHTAYDSFYDVYYFTPYRGLPTLSFPLVTNAPDRTDFEIIEQRPDGFRIRMHSFSNIKSNGIAWVTTGSKAR